MKYAKYMKYMMVIFSFILAGCGVGVGVGVSAYSGVYTYSNIDYGREYSLYEHTYFDLGYLEKGCIVEYTTSGLPSVYIYPNGYSEIFFDYNNHETIHSANRIIRSDYYSLELYRTDPYESIFINIKCWKEYYGK